jgi:starch synthase
MDGVLRERSSDLYGIVNGYDTHVWDPAKDPMIAARYSAADLEGKSACKAALQEHFGLKRDSRTPLIGMISRLVDQKGIDLLPEALPRVLESGIQVVVLGKGEQHHHDMLEQVRRRHEGSMGLRLAYDDALAHQIEAGSDMFLMPSKFEPCGLNQLYSMRYGTVPVARATGGLVDTVIDADEGALERGEATGFLFGDYSAAALMDALRRALDVYKAPDRWRRLMLTGMAQDWSWGRSAREYSNVYEIARSKVGRDAAI